MRINDKRRISPNASRASFSLNQFDLAPGLFNGFPGFLTDGVDLNGHLGFGFPDAKDLHQIRPTYQSMNIKIIKAELIQLIFLDQVIQLSQIEDFVFYPVSVLEAPLGEATLDGHLPSFKSLLGRI